MQVLLFEEENDIGFMLRRALEESGYFVTVTTELDVAYQMFEKIEFDLIIINILLPSDRVMELVEIARARDIRIFVMTGSQPPLSQSRAAAGKTDRKNYA